MTARSRHRTRTLLLLVAALLAMGADVCVLPMHVHATASAPIPAAADTPAAAGTHHDDDATPDHALHTASCEALRGGPFVATPILVVQPLVSLEVIRQSRVVA